MAQIYDTERNIFQKHPSPGVDLLLGLLKNEISSYKAVELFEKDGVKVSRRTIDRHMKNIREKSKLASTGKFSRAKRKESTDLVSAQTAALMKELREIENIDYSKIKDTNPVKILDKNMMKLELMLTRSVDTREVGAIIELEMKLADKLHKMRPVSTEFNLNEILSKLDLTTSFIEMLDKKHPEATLKADWLNYLLENE